MRPRVAVVGGGISGLAAASRLAEAAMPVETVLLESAERLGGVLETVQQDGFSIEAAADGFLTSPATAVDLCRRVGLADALIGTNPFCRKAFVVREDHLEPIPESFALMAPGRIRPLISSPILSVAGKLRLGMEYFVPRKQSDEDESLASFVRRRFGREMLERIVQPLVGGIYTADPERLSMQATMPRFLQMERDHGSLIRAMLRQRRKAQGESASGARYGHFASLREGMSSLVASLAEQLLPGTVRLNSPVQRIVPMEGGRWLLSVGRAVRTSLVADGLILATPAYRTGRLLADVEPELAAQLESIDYASCVVVSLGYRREQIRHPLDGFGLVVPLAEQRAILSCSFSSIKYEGRAPEGAVLLRVFIGGACQSGLLCLPSDQLLELAEREVSDLLGIRGAPILRHLRRHTQAMPQYAVGHTDRVARIKTLIRRHRLLALAGAAYDGVGVPGCIRSGTNAAEQLLETLNRTSPLLQSTCT